MLLTDANTFLLPPSNAVFMESNLNDRSHVLTMIYLTLAYMILLTVQGRYYLSQF